MDLLGCFKCVSCLLKALKMVQCVKKIFTVMIIAVMILIGISSVLDNKKAIEKAVKSIKKKVM